MESLLTTNQKGELFSLGLLYKNAGQMIVTHSAFNVMNSVEIAINIYSNWFFDRLSIMFRAYSFCNFLNKEVLNLSYFLYTGYFALPLNTF